ncbi:MAG TPA: methyltransferase domain-containing protein [Leptolyngbya sp.]|nr:methyltransferase domain-containing protein [Leptolyngbya sp.]
MATHQASIVDQFTRQAIPFSQMPGHTNAESLQLLMDAIALSGEDTVLDVACGTGIVACAFATIANHVTGIDITPAMLEQARLLAEKRHLNNLTWQQGDIQKLPFPDASFSVVLSRYAFHHFLQPDAVLAEMIRVCRPGGRILIADVAPPLGKEDAYNQFEKLRDPSHTRALTLEEFQSLVANANLQDVNLAFYKVEMELEQQLAASFPNPGDDEKIRQMLKDDLGIDRLGVAAHLRDGEIHYAYPIAVIVAKTAA